MEIRVVDSRSRCPYHVQLCLSYFLRLSLRLIKHFFKTLIFLGYTQYTSCRNVDNDYVYTPKSLDYAKSQY